MEPLLALQDVSKSFTMHQRGSTLIPVMKDVTFSLQPGQCAVLAGPSGIGKSSILKMLYGNYAIDKGNVKVRLGDDIIDIAGCTPRMMLAIRRDVIAYVSQFLRCLPRVSALDVVGEPLVQLGIAPDQARAKAMLLLERLNLPKQLWHLPPTTFSGGEQQRVNIARGLITDHPILLLDEPTASLDQVNRQVVVDMIGEKKQNGTALLGIFHDVDVRDAVGDIFIDVSKFAVERPV